MRRTLDPDTRESTLKRSMRRRTRTAPLITPFTCREREGQVGKLYFPGTFLTFLPLSDRGAVAMARRTDDPSRRHGSSPAAFLSDATL